jgi:hypothetical protein
MGLPPVAVGVTIYHKHTTHATLSFQWIVDEQPLLPNSQRANLMEI